MMVARMFNNLIFSCYRFDIQWWSSGGRYFETEILNDGAQNIIYIFNGDYYD